MNHCFITKQTGQNIVYHDTMFLLFYKNYVCCGAMVVLIIGCIISLPNIRCHNETTSPYNILFNYSAKVNTPVSPVTFIA